MNKRVWRIVPGDKNHRDTILGKFLRGDYVAVGWLLWTPNLTNVPEDQFESRVDPAMSGMEKKVVHDFRYEMRKGDTVIVSADGKIYAIGEIMSDYYYGEEKGQRTAWRSCFKSKQDMVWPLGGISYPHRRNVSWKKILKLGFDKIPKKVARRLGNPPALIELSQDDWVLLSLAIIAE